MGIINRVSAWEEGKWGIFGGNTEVEHMAAGLVGSTNYLVVFGAGLRSGLGVNPIVGFGSANIVSGKPICGGSSKLRIGGVIDVSHL